MKEQDCSVAVVTLVAVAVFFTACNRVPGMKSAPAVTGVATQPAPQRPQPSAAAQTAPAILSSPLPLSASSSLPVGAPKSDVPPPKVVVSDRSQTLMVAQHTFRFLTHVQSIPATSEETVEWWELRDANEHLVYRQSYPVTFMNGSFEWMVSISAKSFTTKQGGGILIEGGEEPSAPDSGGWVQVFGFKYGREKYGVDESLFGPFGPPIFIDGEFLEVGTDSFRPTPTSIAGVTTTVMNDVLKFRMDGKLQHCLSGADQLDHRQAATGLALPGVDLEGTGRTLLVSDHG